MPKRKPKKVMPPSKVKEKGPQDNCIDKSMEKAETNQPTLIEGEVFCFFNVTDTLKEIFTNYNPCTLTKVIVVGQDKVNLAQIGQLTNVKELWITECNLQEVPHITSESIEKLYLHSNRLDYIPDLTYMSTLQVLWLHDNKVHSIEGLYRCLRLEDLNLANNLIENLDRLCNMINLITLNLSGNPIHDIKEIQKLNKLKSLKHLMFADPMYKISPISHILNYRTIAVYHLPNLSTLDSFAVLETEIKNAQDYYRIKKIQYSNVFQKIYNDYYEHLRKKKDLAKVELHSIKEKLIRCALKEKQAMITTNNDLMETCKWEQRHLDNDILRWETTYTQQDRQQENIMQMNMKIMDFEMSYAGNIKLENHEANSELSILCQQLLYEYACPLTSKEAYVERIIVDNVTHIVDKLSGSPNQLEMVNHLKPKGKPSKFYLLVDPVPVTNVDGWPFDLLADYFNRYSIEDYDNKKFVVTNCLAVADSNWLNSNEIHKKVFLTNEKHSKRLAVFTCVPSTANVIMLPPENHLHTSRESDSCRVKCCKYSVKASSCIFSFIVQFHYVYQDLMKAYQKLIKNEKKKDTKNEILNSALLTSCLNLSEFSWKSLVDVTLTKCMMSTFGDVSDTLPNVKSIDVSYNDFESLEEFGLLFPKLLALNISYNNLPSLTTLKATEYLEKLNVSWNNLTSFGQNLIHLKQHATSLKFLDASYNCYDDVHFFCHEPYFAKKGIPTLRKYNDTWISDLDDWPEKTFEGIYDLPVVQGEATTHIAGCNAKWTGDAWCQIERTRGPHVCVSARDRTVSCLSLVGGQNFYKLRFSLPLPGLTSLTVSTNFLQDVSFLIGLPQLRRLDLSKNTLNSDDVDFTNNPHLLYLDLSCNYLTSLDFVRKSNLNKLKVFNASMNKIKSLRGLEKSINLEQLYISCNQLTTYESIKIVKFLQNLIIIDLTSNKLPSLRDMKKFIANTIKNIEYINGSQLIDSELVDVSTHNSTLDADYLLRFYKITALHNLTELTVPKAAINRVILDGGVVNHMTSVNLEGNHIDRLCDLVCIPNLTNLCLSHNKVKRFKSREEDYVESSIVFEKLEILHLDDNGLTEVDGLELNRMPALKTLFLQDNLISSLTGLFKAKNLTNLILDRNRLRNIQHIDVNGLHSLSQLYLESNYIESLQFLSSIPRLTKLFIANNRIYDFMNMHWLTSTKQITELTISGNPVNSCGTLLKFLLQTLPNLTLLNGFDIKTKN